LTQAELGLMLRLHHDGLTQTAIAQRLDVNQAAVSRWLNELTDTTDISKSYLRGSALTMARNIVKNGRAADHVAALKGLSVLHDEQSSSVTVIVGGSGQVNIGVGLSPTPDQDKAKVIDIAKV
jgi:DNA-binding IclR family transcriptional regulator